MIPRTHTSPAQHIGTPPTQHINAAPAHPAHAAPTPHTRTSSAARARARTRTCARARLARLLVLPAVVLFAMLGGAPAQAADGYRYWSFWQRGGDGGGWTYSTQGPSSARPGDGDTIGFRFAVSEDSDDATRPRGTADFAAVCADTPAKDGTKRVAVVLDFGTAADAPDHRTPPAPRTECARVGEDASAGEALAAVAKPLRYNSAALLCAIAGYPESGCGDKVSSSVDAHAVPKSDGDKADGDSGPSAGLIGGLVAVVLLGAAAVWQARRRRA
ncbi:SCO2322 family protein [Streptomyces hygroscopicus]|uniref:SCO2322 family protein n=1 Tax=Streptomyces hygroscopicus TaxID=1912 RepID=UPI0036B6C63C